MTFPPFFFLKFFYYSFLTNGPRDRGLGEEKRGSETPDPQPLPNHPFPPYIFIIYIQASGIGIKGNSLSGVVAIQAPSPLETQAPLLFGEALLKKVALSILKASGFSIQCRASGGEACWSRSVC